MPETPHNKTDILIVDDDIHNIKMAEKILHEDYRIMTAGSGGQALEMLREYEPRLILLDYHMSGMNGAETMKALRENPAWSRIPVIILTSDYLPETEKECFQMGAADFIAKPFVPTTVKSRIDRIVELYTLRRDLESRLEEKSRMLENVSLSSIMAIANAIDAKDAYTSGHSVRVAKCAAEIAKKLGWNDEDVRNLYHIGLLHDIGKIGVPDAILNKPSRLNDEEFAQIKKHPLIGGEILKNIHMIEGVSDGAMYHHERYDGKGYPFGLKGEDIPLCARIIAIADTYDAMTSNRIYRAKLPDSKVLSEFERCAGTQFDPKLAGLFAGMLREGFQLPQEYRRKGDDRGDAGAEAADGRVQLGRVLSEYSTDKNTADFLTGLYNRSYGETKISSLLDNGHKGALLIVDLDNLKGVNDRYGHLMGDRVLKLLASELSAAAGEKDVAYRIGGDEFVLFFTDLVQRNEVEEHIRAVMDAFDQSTREIGCPEAGHISVGVALSPADGKSFSVLYNNADKALYYVKKSGKNDFNFFRDAQPGTSVKKPDMDLDHIRRILEGRMDKRSGAFKVPYEEFQNLYGYLSRCVKRKGQMVQILLFTIGNEGKEYLDNSAYEDAMAALEVTLAYSLRMVDVGSRYSSLQYIVILVDTNLENGRKVAERIIHQFYKIYSGTGMGLTYDIQTIVM